MSHIPRNHFLLLHDALRKILGPDARLAAFVKAKRPFQCDMLVNAARTDVDTLARVGQRSSSLEKKEDDAKEGIAQFARELQALLGNCDVLPHTRRIDVVFRDRHVIQLALGAAARDIPFPLQTGADVNRELNWRRRNRLRISLGYDEELFLAQCTRSVNVAARVLEKSMYDYHRHSVLLAMNAELQAAYKASGGDWHAVLPPVTYWQVHCYALNLTYPCRHYQQLAATVEHNFATYYAAFPLINPYCDGEDLNTMQVARWLCSARAPGAMLHDPVTSAGQEKTADWVVSTDVAGVGEGDDRDATTAEPATKSPPE